MKVDRLLWNRAMDELEIRLGRAPLYYEVQNHVEDLMHHRSPRPEPADDLKWEPWFEGFQAEFARQYSF